VGESAFEGAYNLRHVTIGPDDVVIRPREFFCCFSLEVIAASFGFELDTGDRFVFGSGNWNDPTVGITRFAKWRNQMDEKKECYQEYYKTAIVMLELANTPLHGHEGMRATTEDSVWAILAESGRNMANFILFFELGVKVGRKAT